MPSTTVSTKPIPFQTYPEVRDYLYALRNRGTTYGIDRMIRFVGELGHPEHRVPMIHIAGSNGKGSTAAILESIYRHAGYRTGLFTSPHLVHQGERVQVNRQILTHDAIVGHTNRLREVAERIAVRDPEMHPSFFEFMTAMAFERFVAEGVDIGVLETGLGGRLDATNVVLPEVSIITSISLDHCHILGDTLEIIAREKAGIIKPGRPVVLGHLPPTAEAVIREIAGERGSPVTSIRERFGEDIEADAYPRSALEGRYQRWNTATAVLTVELLAGKFPVSKDALREGLDKVFWAGRWERRRVEQGKLLILDASHNPEGSAMLAENLHSLEEETGKQPIFITGSLGEVRATALYPVVARYAREIHLVQPRQPRASTYEILEAAIPKAFPGPVHRSTVADLFPFPGVCSVGEPEDVIVCTGSIYLLGEILEALDHPSPVAEETLQD